MSYTDPSQGGTPTTGQPIHTAWGTDVQVDVEWFKANLLQTLTGDATITVTETAPTATVARAAITGDVSVPAASNAAVVQKINGVTVTGTPSAGYVIQASSSSASAWGVPSSPSLALTDGATISVNAALANNFTVTIAGNRTIANPTNPVDGQTILFQVTQGTGGNFTLTFGSAYEFPTGLTQPTLSTTAGLTDILGFMYNATKTKWLFMAYVLGYS